jgi:phage-related protein
VHLRLKLLAMPHASLLLRREAEGVDSRDKPGHNWWVVSSGRCRSILSPLGTSLSYHERSQDPRQTDRPTLPSGGYVAVKPIRFVGDTLQAIRNFPASAKSKAGHQLERVQRGLDPQDWRPMRAIGAGMREIRVRDESGAFRVIYLAAMHDAIYVLHAFQKKTQQTARRDVELAARRFRQVARSVET